MGSRSRVGLGLRDGVLKHLVIVVTCSNRKAAEPIEALRARSLPSLDTSGRVQAWVERLATTDSLALPARDLYKGEHWQVALSLPLLGRQLAETCELWVCSAGYGLVSADARLKPYAASFAARDRDAVARTEEQAGAWWRKLTELQRAPGAESASLTGLAQRWPDATFMVVGSAAYLGPMAGDLLAAVRELSDPASFWLLSCGVNGTGPLTHLVLPGDARLQHEVGGTRQALNVRVAEWILSAAVDLGILDRRTVEKNLSNLLERLPEVPTYGRKPSSDHEIKRFVRQNPGVSRTALLREFRDLGMACEQGRFKRIYDESRGGG